MIILTAVSEVSVITQLKVLLLITCHFTVSDHDIKRKIRTICLKLEEYLNTKITIRLSHIIEGMICYMCVHICCYATSTLC